MWVMYRWVIAYVQSISFFLSVLVFLLRNDRISCKQGTLKKRALFFRKKNGLVFFKETRKREEKNGNERSVKKKKQKEMKILSLPLL